MLNPKSRNEISDSNAISRRQRLETENSVGKRIVEALEGRDLKWLSRESGISHSTLSGYIANGIASAEKAVAIGRALNRSVEWLISGRNHIVGRDLVDARDADWIDVPKYDLRQINDDGLGKPLLSVSMRKDWLYANFRVSSGLWLTQLIAEYRPADLREDMIVVCRTMHYDEISENHVCLWRYNDNNIVGRYSVQPDALLARGLSREGLPLGSVVGVLGTSILDATSANAIMGFDRRDPRDLIVSPSQIGEGDGRYHLIGRILGIFIRPI